MSDDASASEVLLTGGALSLTAAALAGAAAWRHMQAISDICGAAQAHCGWCFVAAGLAAAGTAALGAWAKLDHRKKAIARVTATPQK